MSRAPLMMVAAALCVASVSVSTDTPHFYPDDPIARTPESQNAIGAKPYSIQSMYEMTYNLFVTAGLKASGTRARDLNSIDEVPDSSWFTNRIGPNQTGPNQTGPNQTGPAQLRPTTDAIARGPIVGAAPDPSHWVLLGEKTAGVHPGFRARDARGETWFIELDPKTNPEGATAALTIATKFFWALGYNQVETFLTTFDPKLATIDPAAKVRRPSGKKTAFTWDDLHSILETAARNPDGTYRIVAGRLIPGKILGNFLFAGTRSDDPNDIIPHEDRRELRALRVFGAWTNLTDLKAGNTLDALVTENGERSGRATVKHYLQDVGSTFGMCNDVHEWDLSYEYFYDAAKTRRRFFSLGFALSPWQTIPYVDYPSIGKFEGDHFDPRAWRPQTPTTAYMEMRDDDAFWAARRVAAFSEEQIRAAVHTGQFSDPAAERYLGDVLIKRQRKIAETYLTAINPIVDPRLDASGRLTVGNAAVDAGVAANVGGGGAEYRAVWMRFDNATGATSPIGETQSATTTIDAPRGLPAAPDSFIQVDLSIDAAGYPSWHQPAHAWFRRVADGWTLVGFERLPATGPSARHHT